MMHMVVGVKKIVLEDLNLDNAERLLVEAALEGSGSIVGAAPLLGIDRNAVKRRITKHKIEWPKQPKGK